MKNKSLGSRLPKWMTSKKNRETILKAITQLKNKYGERINTRIWDHLL